MTSTDAATMPSFPEEFIKHAEQHRNGLQFVRLGDDGDIIAIVGHPSHELVNEYTRSQESEWGNDPDEYAPTADELDYTWARLLRECPDHTEPVEYCGPCNMGGEWWCDFDVEDGQPLDANAGKLGYFPVVVWRAG